MDSDQLGAKGEARFREICADAGMICNPSSERDRGGWDFIVEVADDLLQTGISFDKREGLISAHIQVKTIRKKDKNRIKLSLSSAEFLAKEPKPSFIYIFIVGSDLTFESSYIIHVWDQALEKVLKGLRSAERKKTRLNKLSLTFEVSKQGKAINATGVALKNELLSVVAHDINKYISDKRALRDALGFESNSITTHFTLEGNSVEELEECIAGERSISVSDFQVYETRFGIKLPLAGGPQKTTMHIKPQAVIKSVLRAKAAGNQASIEISVIGTPFRRPSEGGLVKLVHDLFEFKIRGREVSFSTDPNQFQEKRKTIKFWKCYFEFMVTLTTPGSRLELKTPNGIYQELSSNMSLGVSEGAQLQNLLRGILAVEDILAYCGEEAVELSLSEVTEVMRPAANLAETLIKPNAPVQASFTIEKNETLKEKRNITALFIDAFMLSDKIVAYAFTAEMSGEDYEDCVRYISDKCVLLDLSLLDPSNANYKIFSEKIKKEAGDCDAVVAREFADDEGNVTY